MTIKVHRKDGTSFVYAAPARGDWSKERIALLRRLWKTSAPSSEIALAICELPGAPVTKSACCGKARRLGLGDKPNALTAEVNFDWRGDRARRAWQTRRENGTDRVGARRK
jgi:hypothetical protein